MLGGPAGQRGLNRAGDIGVLGAAVEQKRPIVAEDQVEKWLFIVRTTRLAKDVEVGVVLVEPGSPAVFRIRRRSGRDDARKVPRSRPAPSGLRRLGDGDPGECESEEQGGSQPGDTR